MKKNKISKNWLNKRKKDLFFTQSKIQGYRSRSAFKLIEMNKKFRFLKENLSLLDLGASPGGWSQVAKREIKKGKILAVDVKKMDTIQNVNFIEGSFLEASVFNKIKAYFNDKADVVLSDMAVNTSGNKNLDSYRTGELCIGAMDLAREILRQDGVFVSKLFMGSVYLEINQKANKYFKKVLKFKPTSSRKESKEIYIYCKGLSKSFNFS